MALVQYITQVQFDFGALSLVASECARLGISRPLVCTDRGIVAAGPVCCNGSPTRSAICFSPSTTARRPIRPRRRCAKRRQSFGSTARTD